MTRVMREPPLSPPLSIVILARNAAASLPATFAALAEGRSGKLIREVILADGGSTDGTREVARSAGADVISAPVGRGAQLASGALRATGPWLLFLHADTVLAPGWAATAAAFMADPANGGRAAVFRLVLDDAHPRARRIERLARWRGRVFGLPYGDQGLLIAADFYRALGGYRPLPLMEDVDFARRIGRRRLELLDVAAITSAARYRTGGWWLRPLRNLAILALYFLGVPPRLLLWLYA
jgi:rSAM/selenodomain-associated transferase 2